jgi:SAM-dependent methyltransferase
MSLGEVLRALTGVESLPRLTAALGYHSVFQELPPGSLPGLSRAAVVGRQGGFTWMGGEGEEALARRLSRAYHARGDAVGILLLDRSARRLAVSVSSRGAPTLGIALDEPDQVSLARLSRAAAAGEEPAVGIALRISDALHGRGLDYRFFLEFRRTLERVTGALPSAMPLRDRHAFGLLQLTRILFLYFVEAKGWLAGRPRFLREEVDHCLSRRRRLHRDLLRPLFFGTLNRPAHERRALARRFGEVPFLNGGLFEPHALERRWRVELPTTVVRDAFDQLFERFHFTLDTGSGERIAPDMLGRVFEGVMEPAERHGTGSYYTPAPVVDSLLREGVSAWLERRLGVTERDAERLATDPDRTTDASLRGARILDPAAGSGAFLLGALRLLGGPDTAPSAARAQRLRRILGRNLYGVDLNPAAIRLAELRLWLEVIGADPSERPARVEPLPNLDAAVRQGDSLLDPLAGLPIPPAGAGRSPLASLRARLVGATGEGKRHILSALRGAERALALQQVAAAGRMLEAEIAELLDVAACRTLFGSRTGLGAHRAAQLRALRKRLHQARARGRELERNDTVPWFHYPTHFADAFAAGGFDLVVGNPPWVRAEALDAVLRHRLSERYRWFGAQRGTGRGFHHLPDLSVAFLERAVDLLAPGGVLAFLIPAKIATTGYAAAARGELARRTTLIVAADLAGDRSARFDATVYPMALVARKEAAPEGHRVRLAFASEGPRLPQSELGRNAWVLVNDEARAAVDRMRATFPSLADHVACHLGVKTGLNRAFLDPPDDVEPALVRWAIRGRDVGPFEVAAAVRLLWAYDDTGRPLTTLPPRAAAHLAQHLGALRRRTDLGGEPPWTLFRTGPATRPHRVIWPDLARRLTASPLTGASRTWIPLNTCYVIPVRRERHALCLAAWLNSSWCRAMAAVVADKASGGFLRFNARVVSGLPLPGAVFEDDTLLALARDARAAPLRQNELDARTAELLSLTQEERDALASVAPDRAVAGR